MELKKAENKRTAVDLMSEGYAKINEDYEASSHHSQTQTQTTNEVIDDKLENGNLDGIDAITLISHGLDNLALDTAAERKKRRDARNKMQERGETSL